MLASRAEHWRHHPCCQPWDSAELLLFYCFWGKWCTGKYVPERQHDRTRNRAQTILTQDKISFSSLPLYLFKTNLHGQRCSMCVCHSLFLSCCSTQQSIGTMTGYLSDWQNERKEKDIKSSLNSIMNFSTCFPKSMKSSAWWPKDKF